VVVVVVVAVAARYLLVISTAHQGLIVPHDQIGKHHELLLRQKPDVIRIVLVEDLLREEWCFGRL